METKTKDTALMIALGTVDGKPRIVCIVEVDPVTQKPREGEPVSVRLMSPKDAMDFAWDLQCAAAYASAESSGTATKAIPLLSALFGTPGHTEESYVKIAINVVPDNAEPDAERNTFKNGSLN